MCCHFCHGIKTDFCFQGTSDLEHLEWLQQSDINMSNKCIFEGITKYHRGLTNSSDVTKARCKSRVIFNHTQPDKTLNVHCSSDCLTSVIIQGEKT